jgi:hypothetical protein
MLEFAVSRLRWCLNQPLVCGGRDWGACVYRALQQLGEGLERQVELLEGADGLLAQIADPSLLPFTEEAKRARELRAQYNRLRQQIQAVSIQFRDALLLFPCDSGVPEDGIADARAFRLYGVLGCCAADVLNAVEEYRTAEASLLGATQETPEVFGNNNSTAARTEPGGRLGAWRTARPVKPN